MTHYLEYMRIIAFLCAFPKPKQYQTLTSPNLKVNYLTERFKRYIWV